MLGKGYECRQNRCAKPIWKQRSPVSSWRGKSAGNQSETVRPQDCWKRANGGSGQLRKSELRLAGRDGGKRPAAQMGSEAGRPTWGGRGQLRKSGLRPRQRRSGRGIVWQRAETSRFYCESGSPRGVQGKSGRQSWSQAKDRRSCGGPTGEFAPVKVENEFADGKIC